MDSSNKPTSDFLIGVHNREIVAHHFNDTTLKYQSPIRIRRYHPNIKMMSPSEKQRFNTNRNRHSNDDERKAMGLDYELYSIEGPDTPLRLQIRFSDGGGHYLKVPSDRLQDVEKYLEEIQNITYALFVFKNGEKVLPHYSNLLLLRDIIKHGYHMSTTTGNLNRLQFEYNTGSFQYLPLVQGRGFFELSVLEQCEKLFQ